MTKNNIEAVYPLSPMQQGMLFHSLVAPESGVYVEQLTCRLVGALDFPAFEQAWQRVVQRHSTLRTAFAWKRFDQVLQAVQHEVQFNLQQEDWSELSKAEQDAQLRTFLRTERKRGFDLSKAPLFRLTLIKTAPERYCFV